MTRLQVMQRFADSVRVQSLVQSERSLCYTLLQHALEVRYASCLLLDRASWSTWHRPHSSK